MASRNYERRHSKKLTLESLESRRLLAADWQNPGQARDVSRDLAVSPIDALLGINRLNSGLSRDFPPRPSGSTEPYFDVDGSGDHNPLDVLLVINALNRRQPTAAVELLSDSGVGPGANLDRRTNDLSVRGMVSMVPAGELWGRFEFDDQWHDLTAFLANDQTFTISHDDLVDALGGLPNDGTQTLRFQPRWGVGNIELGTEVDLPVTLDTTPPHFDFEIQPNFLGPINLPSSNLIEVPLSERGSLLTLVASQIKLYDATFSELATGFTELVPRGISLSNDGFSLLVEPPTNASSIRYFVAVGESAFEDVAGNLNSAFNPYANHFSDSAETPVAFGQRSDVSSLQRVVRDFTFNLNSPDLFILGGLTSTKESQLELLSPSGASVRVWTTGTAGGKLGLGSDNWAFLTELGQYRLRVAVPALNEVSFKAYLSSRLSSVPASLQLGGTFTWSESQAYAITVTNQDRIYVENQLAPQTPFRATLLNQYGQPLHAEYLNDGDAIFDTPIPGRYIVLIEAFDDLRPLAFDYALHLSTSTNQPLIFGQFYEQALTTPGQQAFYHFAAKAAQTYTLEFDSEFGSLAVLLPDQMETAEGSYPVEKSGAGFVRFSFGRSDVPSTFARFRLSEAVSIANPPATGTVHIEPLQQGVTQRTIPAELDSYEFTFNANANELFAFRDGTGGNFIQFRLVTPSGSELSLTEQAQATGIFRIPHSGQYRLRAFGGVGTLIHFQWQNLSTATSLLSNGDVHGDFPEGLFAAYKFVATDPRFFAHATVDAEGLVWKLLDPHGLGAVTERDFNLELDLPVTVGRTYILIIEKQLFQPDDQYDFRRVVPITNTRSAALGEAITGTLMARGDRQVLELALTAGQLIQLTSNLDPSVARVRWLNLTTNDPQGFENEIDPSRPDRIGNTRTHRVEIQNLNDAAIDYSLEFSLAPPSFLPPPQLAGFDQVHSGTVGATPQSFTFDISAGGLYLLDWLLTDDTNIEVEITDALGDIVPRPMYGTDSMQRADSVGPFTVKIRSLSSSTLPFSYRLLSPNTAETIALGIQKSASIIAFGSGFFRIPVTGATDIFLEAILADSGNSTRLYRVPVSDPSGQGIEGPFYHGQFLSDEALVWATNVEAEAYQTTFTPRDVASIPLVAIDSPITIPTEAGRVYLVPFQTTAAVTLAGTSPSVFTDQAGEVLNTLPEGNFYHLREPGQYRAIVFGDGTSMTFEVHKQVVTAKVVTLGQAASGTISKPSDVHRYPITLTAGTPLMLSMLPGAGRIASWIAPDGEAILPDLQLGWAILPVYLSGVYHLDVIADAANAQYIMQLIDLSQLAAIAAGLTQGTITSNLVSVRRFEGTPKQLMELENTSITPFQVSIVDRHGKLLSDVGFLNNPMRQMPDDGVAYILAEPLGNDSLEFSYFANLVATQVKLATLGLPQTGSLATKWQGTAYAFQVDAPTWVRVAVDSTQPVVLGLSKSDGTVRDSYQGFFELLLAGNHSVSIYNYSHQPNSYTLLIDLIDQTPLVPVNQVTQISKGGRYRLEIANPGRYELRLRDSQNQIIPATELVVTNLHGDHIEFVPRGSLDSPGGYWLSFNEFSNIPAGNYFVSLIPITTTESTLSVGSLGEFALNADGLQERIVSLVIQPGMRLVIDELELGSGGFVEARFRDSFFSDWLSVDQLPLVLFGASGEETLQFRIGGTGLVRLHLQDLNAAPMLTLSTALNVELGLRRQGQAWLIGGNIGDTIEFINDASAVRPALWMIVDESGNIVAREIDKTIRFSIVNRQRFALVIRANEPLTASFTVPFHTVVY